MTSTRLDILLGFKSKLSGLSRAVKMVRTLAIAVSAATIAYAAFAAKQSVTFGSEMSDAATRTGATVEQVQVLTGAMKDAGGEAADMERILSRTTKAIGDAARGSTEMLSAFNDLNLNVDQLKRLDLPAQLQAIAVAFGQAEDETAAMNSLFRILGDENAPKLIEVLDRLGRDGYEKLAEDVSAAYGIMSTETAIELDMVSDRLGQVQNQITVFAGESIVKLQPALEAFSQLAGWTSTVLIGVQNITQELGFMAGALGWDNSAGIITYDQAAIDAARYSLNEQQLIQAEASRLRAEARAASVQSSLNGGVFDDSASEMNKLRFQISELRADRAEFEATDPIDNRATRANRLTSLHQERDLLAELYDIAKSRAIFDKGGQVSDGDVLDAAKITGIRTELARVNGEIGKMQMGFGSIERSLSGGIASGLRGMRSGSADVGMVLETVSGSVIDNMIGRIADFTTQWLISRLTIFQFGRSMDVAEVAASGAKNTALAAQTVAKAGVETAALTPPATLASISSFGLATVLGVAALAAVLATGFAEGGYTGSGGKYAPAGVVHRGEYVFDAAATSRLGVPLLESLRSGRAAALASSSAAASPIPGAAGPGRMIVVNDRRDLRRMLREDPSAQSLIIDLAKGNRFALGATS